MFGVRNHAADSASELIAGPTVTAVFRATIADVTCKPVPEQLVIAQAVNLAYGMYSKVYASSSAFRGAPEAERLGYIQKLLAIEECLRDRRKEPLAAVGFGLLRMWLTVLSDDDQALSSEFGNALAQLTERSYGQCSSRPATQAS